VKFGDILNTTAYLGFFLLINDLMPRLSCQPPFYTKCLLAVVVESLVAKPILLRHLPQFVGSFLRYTNSQEEGSAGL